MSIARLAVQRPVTIAMMVMAVMLFGLVGFSRLAVSLLPDLSYPTLTIRTSNAGAAPAEIEQLISRRIEEAIGTVKGIRKIQSISKSGQSDVIVEFHWGSNMNMALLELRERLDTVQLPKELRKPVILRFNPSLDPIMRLTITPNSTEPSALKALRIYLDQDIKRQLEMVSGVAAVQLGGGLEQEIQVLFDQQKMQQRQIVAQTIVDRIRNENVNVSAGRVYDGQQEFLVRALNQFNDLQQLSNLIIKQDNQQVIYLRDVATVVDGIKERKDITRVNGQEAIELAIYKEGDANTVAVAEEVQRALKTIKSTLPKGMQLTTIYDQSEFIVAAVNEVKNTAFLGGVLSMLVLYLFLGRFKPTLIISLAIPVSIVATFNLMYGHDISLNVMSLGGIALAVGMLVDNAIVVLENIYRHHDQGASVTDAAINGTQEVTGAVTASTLTTLAVFAPLAFVTGFAGEIFSDQALTVTFALLASLIVALTLIPMLAARQLQLPDVVEEVQETRPMAKRRWWQWPLWLLSGLWRGPKWLFGRIFAGVWWLLFALGRLLNLLATPLHRGFVAGYQRLANGYQRLLPRCLARPGAVVGSTLLFSAAVLMMVPKLGMELIPEVAQSEVTLEITLQQGTPIAQTDGKLRYLANSISGMPGIKHSYSLAGTGSLMLSTAARGGENWGMLLIATQTPTQLAAVQQRLRQELASMPELTGEFKQTSYFVDEKPLLVVLRGFDLVQLKSNADRLVSLLQKQSNLADVSSSLRAGQPELKIHFDNERLSTLGITAAELSQRLATKVGGAVASKYNLSDRQVDILVRSQQDQRDSVAAVSNLIVHGNDGRALPLSMVADIEQNLGPNEITRLDQQRVALVSAAVVSGDLAHAAAQVERVLADMKLPVGVTATVEGQNQQMQSSYQSLMLALALAVCLVYLVMASQFESLLNPLIIMLAVPLAVLGAVLALLMTGTSLSVIALIGVIMLAGIVVNNAIVLIDRIKQLRDSGETIHAAIIEAAQSRLRPIIMTTMTTVLGLLPMAFAAGEGAELRAPLAITVMGGLVVSTLLTLVVIPVFYQLFNRERQPVSATQPTAQNKLAEVPHG